MAYSNIKKDKTQIGRGERLKKLLFSGLLALVTFSSILNIYRQINTLSQARIRNLGLKEKIEKIKEENEMLNKQIEEAGKKETIDRKQREYFGRGTAADVWLTLPPENIYPTIKPTEAKKEQIPLVMQWWNLFTK